MMGLDRWRERLDGVIDNLQSRMVYFPYKLRVVVPVTFTVIGFVFFQVAAFSCQNFIAELQASADYRFGYWGFLNGGGCSSFKDGSYRLEKFVAVVGTMVAWVVTLAVCLIMQLWQLPKSATVGLAVAMLVLAISSLLLLSGLRSDMAIRLGPGGVVALFSFLCWMAASISMICCAIPKYRRDSAKGESAAPESAAEFDGQDVGDCKILEEGNITRREGPPVQESSGGVTGPPPPRRELGLRRFGFLPRKLASRSESGESDEESDDDDDSNEDSDESADNEKDGEDQDSSEESDEDSDEDSDDDTESDDSAPNPKRKPLAIFGRPLQLKRFVAGRRRFRRGVIEDSDDCSSSSESSSESDSSDGSNDSEESGSDDSTNQFTGPLLSPNGSHSISSIEDSDSANQSASLGGVRDPNPNRSPHMDYGKDGATVSSLESSDNTSSLEESTTTTRSQGRGVRALLPDSPGFPTDTEKTSDDESFLPSETETEEEGSLTLELEENSTRYDSEITVETEKGFQAAVGDFTAQVAHLPSEKRIIADLSCGSLQTRSAQTVSPSRNEGLGIRDDEFIEVSDYEREERQRSVFGVPFGQQTRSPNSGRLFLRTGKRNPGVLVEHVEPTAPSRSIQHKVESARHAIDGESVGLAALAGSVTGPKESTTKEKHSSRSLLENTMTEVERGVEAPAVDYSQLKEDGDSVDSCAGNEGADASLGPPSDCSKEDRQSLYGAKFPMTEKRLSASPERSVVIVQNENSVEVDNLQSDASSKPSQDLVEPDLVRLTAVGGIAVLEPASESQSNAKGQNDAGVCDEQGSGILQQPEQTIAPPRIAVSGITSRMVEGTAVDTHQGGSHSASRAIAEVVVSPNRSVLNVQSDGVAEVVEVKGDVADRNHDCGEVNLVAKTAPEDATTQSPTGVGGPLKGTRFPVSPKRSVLLFDQDNEAVEVGVLQSDEGSQSNTQVSTQGRRSKSIADMVGPRREAAVMSRTGKQSPSRTNETAKQDGSPGRSVVVVQTNSGSLELAEDTFDSLDKIENRSPQNNPETTATLHLPFETSSGNDTNPRESPSPPAERQQDHAEFDERKVAAQQTSNTPADSTTKILVADFRSQRRVVITSQLNDESIEVSDIDDESEEDTSPKRRKKRALFRSMNKRRLTRRRNDATKDITERTADSMTTTTTVDPASPGRRVVITENNNNVEVNDMGNVLGERSDTLYPNGRRRGAFLPPNWNSPRYGLAASASLEDDSSDDEKMTLKKRVVVGGAALVSLGGIGMPYRSKRRVTMIQSDDDSIEVSDVEEDDDEDPRGRFKVIYPNSPSGGSNQSRAGQEFIEHPIDASLGADRPNPPQVTRSAKSPTNTRIVDQQQPIWQERACPIDTNVDMTIDAVPEAQKLETTLSSELIEAHTNESSKKLAHFEHSPGVEGKSSDDNDVVELVKTTKYEFDEEGRKEKIVTETRVYANGSMEVKTVRRLI